MPVKRFLPQQPLACSACAWPCRGDRARGPMGRASSLPHLLQQQYLWFLFSIFIILVNDQKTQSAENQSSQKVRCSPKFPSPASSGSPRCGSEAGAFCAQRMARTRQSNHKRNSAKPRHSSQLVSSTNVRLNLYIGKLAAEFVFSRHVSSDLVPISEKQFYLQLHQPEEAGEHCSLRTRQVFV